MSPFSSMKKPSTQFSLLVALLCSTSLLTFSAVKETRVERIENAPQFSPDEQTERLQSRSQLTPTRNVITAEYIQKRIGWLKVKDPTHYKAQSYIEAKVAEGYQPFILDAWLDGLYDGVVVVGMPGELVLDYYGDPVFINSISYDSAPALEWGIPLLPGRVQKVTIANGTVVRVRA
jgi:hypothetical protein